MTKSLLRFAENTPSLLSEVPMARARPVPTSVVRSSVTGITTFVTTGQGAKFRPGLPVAWYLPNISSIERSFCCTV